MIRRLRPDGSWQRFSHQERLQQLARAAVGSGRGARRFTQLAVPLDDTNAKEKNRARGPLATMLSPSRGANKMFARAMSVSATTSGGGGKNLCCPNCGSALVLAESLAESAAPPQMHAAAKPTDKDAPTPDKKTAAAGSTGEAPTFKKGDVVKCVNCNLHFALKSHPPPPSPAPAMEPPRYRNPAAAAALSSLSSSLSAGVIQTRGSSIGSTGAGSASAAPTGNVQRTPPPPSAVPGRRMNGKSRAFERSLKSTADRLTIAVGNVLISGWRV